MAIDKTPLVSVIIPFINQERFLEEAIKSVIDQDYINWELFLIDDGSKDKSTQIALEYAAKSGGKIIYFDHEGHANRGVSVSRNLANKKARGSLVAYLDADDVWLPVKLSHQVAIFQQHAGIGIVVEASKYWNSWSDPSLKDVIIPVGTSQDTSFDPPTLLYELYPLGKGAAPCPSSLILTKEVVDRSGSFEESFIKEYSMYEDQAYLSKLYLDEVVYISSSCNNLYRQHPNSTVSWVSASGQYKRVRNFYLNWFEAYLKNKGNTNPKLWRMLTKALMPYRSPGYYFFVYTLPFKAITLVKKTFQKSKFIFKLPV